MTVGIYGGTFSPIHNGHIKAARAFSEQCKLDHLYVVPALIPPHKQIDKSDNPEIRYEMVKLAFENYDNITVSDFEIKSKGLSYTVNTLTHFKKITGANLVFLCGADMFVTLDKWHKAAEIFKLTRIAYVNRGNINLEEKIKFYREFYQADLQNVEMLQIDISSTDLRKMIRSGVDVSEYLPKKIYEFITERKIYDLSAQ